jgi:alcohol dehydrogenase (cytochrome c)
VFHGDMNRRFKAFDAFTGKQLWEGIVGGHVAVSTISYAANGKQYIAIMTGDGGLDQTLLAETPEIKAPRGSNSIVVFALPDKK